MSRKSREKSVTGVYHVMLRGINRERIFHDESDFLKFEKILKLMVTPVEEDDTSTACCKLHAYCLMPNHVHLLIEELSDEIGTVMKRIGIAYVSYYNKHYDRSGPLFEDRFKSEPVGDVGYFVTLLRYIHQNPVEAALVEFPGDYRWSSWHEYASDVVLPHYICSMSVPFSGMSSQELKKLVRKVNEAYTQTRIGLSEKRLTDTAATKKLNELCKNGMTIDGIKLLPVKDRISFLSAALLSGIGMRQLSRLANVDFNDVRRAKYMIEKKR